MGLIKEPLDVDFVVEPGMLTEKEKEKISKYINDRKSKAAIKKAAGKRIKRTIKSKRLIG